MSEPREPVAGALLGERYLLRHPLGRGGAGTVWRADDTVLDRPVALKLLHAELERDAAAVARFRREATAAAALTHPNVVIIHDIDEDGGRDFLVMEHVDGVALTDLLASGPLSVPDAVALTTGLADALGAAHDRGLVHRDVKPANVLVRRDGVAKLADFGIATALGDAQARLTTPGMVVGTGAYLAPEQLEGHAVDARADVYALGLLLYEACVGTPPFAGGTAVEVATRRLSADVPTLTSRVPEAGEELDLLLRRATARDPAQRFADGRALAEALRPLAPPDPQTRLALLVSERDPGAAHDEASPWSGDHHAPTATAPASGPDRGSGTDPLGTPVAGDAAAAGPEGTTRAQRQVTGAEASTRAQARVAGADATTRAQALPVPPPGGAGAPGAEPPAPGSGQPATAPEGPSHGPRWRLFGLAALVVAVAVLAVLGATRDDQDGEPDGDGSESGPTPVAVADASDFDPYGDDEHPEDVDLAFDGDEGTSWQTQRYQGRPDLGGLKPGVGIWLQAEPETVRALTLQTRPAGADVAVYHAAEPPTAGDGFDPEQWGTQVGELQGAAGTEEIELDEPVEGGVFLLWFTSLPDDGGGFRVHVPEVTLHG